MTLLDYRREILSRWHDPAEATLAIRVFALQVPGDDQAVRRAYVMGRCVWDREAGHGRA